MIMRTFNDRFSEWFKELSESEMLSVFNEYAAGNKYERVYYIEEFDDICNEMSPLSIANCVRYGDFNSCYPYFTFDGYANFESIRLFPSWVEGRVSDMADWFEDNRRALVAAMGVSASDLYSPESMVEDIPTWALPYLINGDASGMSDDDVVMIDEWMEENGYTTVAPIDADDETFTHVPAFGGYACYTVECECE